MKATGIVRRIDELGRVVIPKELRRTMRIKEGEEMEVFVSPDDSLVLKKYSPLKGRGEYCSDFATAVFRVTGHNCLICDKDVIIACAVDKSVYKDRRISKALYGILEERKAVYLAGKKVVSISNEGIEYKDMAITPIIRDGDVVGGIVAVGKGAVGENTLSLLAVGSDFLASQF